MGNIKPNSEDNVNYRISVNPVPRTVEDSVELDMLK
jgi:hypothetical protein